MATALNQFPQELQNKCFKDLGIKDKISLSSVCRDFYFLIKDHFFYVDVVSKFHPHYEQRLDQASSFSYDFERKILGVCAEKEIHFVNFAQSIQNVVYGSQYLVFSHIEALSQGCFQALYKTPEVSAEKSFLNFAAKPDALPLCISEGSVVKPLEPSLHLLGKSKFFLEKNGMGIHLVSDEKEYAFQFFIQDQVVKTLYLPYKSSNFKVLSDANCLLLIQNALKPLSIHVIDLSTFSFSSTPLEEIEQLWTNQEKVQVSEKTSVRHKCPLKRGGFEDQIQNTYMFTPEWSLSGQSLTCFYEDQATPILTVFDLETGKKISSFPEKKDNVHAFSKDFFLCAEKSHLTLYNLRNGNKEKTFTFTSPPKQIDFQLSPYPYLITLLTNGELIYFTPRLSSQEILYIEDESSSLPLPAPSAQG